MTSFEELLTIMSRLRSADGCPWDRKQTHQSLKPYLLEEAYELLDAIDEKNAQALRDELGDVLLQIIFHAQIAAEAGHFAMDDVVAGLADKLIRRHPHVFGDAQAETAADVIVHWEASKRQERSPDRNKPSSSPFASIPRHLPALSRAEKLQRRAAGFGFDWPDLEGPVEKVGEELRELQQAAAAGDAAAVSEEFGDVLFSLVNAARFLGVQPELALDAANQKFLQRFHKMQQFAAEKGLELETLSLDELDHLWSQAKEKPSAPA